MKKLLMLLFAIFTIHWANAQSVVGTPEQVKTFFDSKTYVVLEGGSLQSMAYNQFIKSAVKESWSITEYEFINHDEFKQKMKNPKNSFLALTEVRFEGESAAFYFLNLFLGKKNARIVDHLPELAVIPLSYVDGIEWNKFAYKMPTLIHFIQHHMQVCKEHPDFDSNKILMHYRKNMELVGDKTLYALKEDLEDEVNTEQKIKDYYERPVKIVSQDELTQIIESQKDDAVFLHKIGPNKPRGKARCYKMILGVADAKLYYFDYHKISSKKPNAFLGKDFKKLDRKQ